MSTIATVLVKYEADTKNIENGLTRIESSVEAIEKSALKSSQAITNVMTSASISMGQFSGNIQTAISEGLNSIDWNELSKDLVVGAVGLIHGVSTALFDIEVWKRVIDKYGTEVLFTIAELLLPPAKFLGGITKALKKIPFVDKIINWLKEQLVAFGKKAYKIIVEPFIDIARIGVEAFLKSFKEKGKRFAPYTTDMIKNGLKKIASFGHDMFIKGAYLFGKFASGIGSKAVGVWNAFSDTIGGAIDKIPKVIIPKMTEKGKQVIEGLWQGIKNSASWFASKVKSWLTSNLPDVVKRILGIRSPSKVFYDFGVNIVEGLEGGIRGKTSSIESVVSDLLRLIAPNSMGLLPEYSLMPKFAFASSFAPSDVPVVTSNSNRRMLANGNHGFADHEAATIQNNYHFGPNSVVISAKDLNEMKTVQDFFARLKQVSRQ